MLDYDSHTVCIYLTFSFKDLKFNYIIQIYSKNNMLTINFYSPLFSLFHNTVQQKLTNN